MTGQVQGSPRSRNAPLVGLDADELCALACAMGEPAYRGRQIYRGLYRDLCDGPAAITPLPISLRDSLARQCEIGIPSIDQRFESTDGTVRYLLRLSDGRTIESVFIPEAARDTLCISTQVGCAVDCKFCLTAQMGLERNLTAGEIAGQVLVLASSHGLNSRKRPLNVVMMGMGEPLQNLPAVMKATRLLADKDGLGIPQRRITVSTSGIVSKIAAFGSHEVRGKLAISLNAASDEQRKRLMPITGQFPLKALLDACRSYPLRPWEHLTFEYVLLREVNDTLEDARRLRNLLAGLKCIVNLIALNPGPGIPFAMPEPARVAAFRDLVHSRIPCFVRRPRGRDILAACGQLKRTAEAAEGGTGPSI